jgi:hypothetical protein
VESTLAAEVPGNRWIEVTFNHQTGLTSCTLELGIVRYELPPRREPSSKHGNLDSRYASSRTSIIKPITPIRCRVEFHVLRTSEASSVESGFSGPPRLGLDDLDELVAGSGS